MLIVYIIMYLYTYINANWFDEEHDEVNLHLNEIVEMNGTLSIMVIKWIVYIMMYLYTYV